MRSDRQLSVKEIKRILKTDGQAYLSLGAPAPLGYVNKTEWEQILEGFSVQTRGGSFEQWAVVFSK
jgi:hypothetical protein